MKKFWIAFLTVLGMIFACQVPAQTKFQTVKTSVKTSKELKFSSNPAIQNFITYYRGGGRVTMEKGLANAGLHDRMIRQIFRAVGVPENLVAISQTLWMSGLETKNSLWLFDDQTAPRYGLRTTEFLDERLSFEKATRATAKYLQFLSNKYQGNWELVLAAYFSGEQNVNNAIQRAKAKNFWKIYKYLPAGTQNFVPNVLATVLIVNNPQKYGFEDVLPEQPFLYDSVSVPALTSLDLIARLSDISLEEIKNLNPELISNSTPPESYTVRVPVGKGKLLKERLIRSSEDKHIKTSA
jgi:membrane-bound lytic murein transglycosylase D